MKFIISTCFGKALDSKQCCMKISFFSHNLLMLSSLIRNKNFFEYKHILAIRYTLFSGMTTKMEKKKLKGELKEQKINVFPQKSVR